MHQKIIPAQEKSDRQADPAHSFFPDETDQSGTLGLNEIYVWFLLPTYPNFFNPTLNIKMVFGEKIPKMGAF